ncbi:helix-turn-helix domain-containing protein [Dactylosporangium sp. McL0621]|uniref:helix-turn-helix domain-containing protein n=1 Tax=Dactylosporangium sp. McL0621 TaxID=3415678 RepID=UPI003CE8666D
MALRLPHDETPPRRRLRAVLLDRLRAAPQQPVHLPAPSDPRLRAVCAILRADPTDDRALAALGAAVGASGRTLTRLFQADPGMTFPQSRTQLRLYHALVLLAERTPVTAVAHRRGWSSTSAFIRRSPHWSCRRSRPGLMLTTWIPAPRRSMDGRQRLSRSPATEERQNRALTPRSIPGARTRPAGRSTSAMCPRRP